MTATLVPPTVAVDPQTPPAAPLASRVRGAGVAGPTVASAVAVLLSALALSPLFEGASWVGATVLVVLAVSAAGGIATWLRAPLALVPVVQAGVLFSVLVARFTEEAPLGFVPSRDAMDELRTVLADGLVAVDRFAPPVPGSEGITAIVALGVGCVALTVFVLQVSLRIPTAAGIPLIATYVVPSSVLADGSPWWAFAFVIAGWLILLVNDERINLVSWGRMLRRNDRAPGTSPFGGLSSAAFRLGAVAVLTSIALPILIPGLADAVIGRVTGAGTSDGEAAGESSDSVGLDPFVSLRRDVRDLTNLTVLRYKTTAVDPSYLRYAVLESFDGTTWKPRAFTPDGSARAADGPFPAIAPDPAVRTTPRSYVITSDRLVTQFLPVPEGVTAVRVAGDWYVDGQTGTIFGTDQTSTGRGDQWSVDVTEVTPTAAQLDAAPELSTEQQIDLREGTQIPSALTALAAEQTQGARTKHEAAVALQRYLQTFTYSTTVTSQAPQSASYLEQFLTEKVGYCEQFAATMALMARSVGIPARVIVGFAPGTANETGEYVVAAKDAHAWPELYFPTIGWVRFEPTPRGPADGGTVRVPPWAAPAPQGPDEKPRTQSDRTGVPNERQVPLEDQAVDPAAVAVADAAAALASQTPVSTADQWRRRGLTALAVAGLIALLTPAVWRWARRRRRLTGTVEDAWSELADSARDLGVPWSDAHTPRQAAEAVIRRQSLSGDVAEATTRLARATERVRYAPTAPSVVGLASDVSTVRGAMWRRADWSARVRAVFLPVSLRRSVT